MESVYVIMSYWYGMHDEAKFGEDSKVERVVRGTKARADEVQREIVAQIKDQFNYCYVEVVETEMCE